MHLLLPRLKIVNGWTESQSAFNNPAPRLSPAGLRLIYDHATPLTQSTILTSTMANSSAIRRAVEAVRKSKRSVEKHLHEAAPQICNRNKRYGKKMERMKATANKHQRINGHHAVVRNLPSAGPSHERAPAPSAPAVTVEPEVEIKDENLALGLSLGLGLEVNNISRSQHSSHAPQPLSGSQSGSRSGSWSDFWPVLDRPTSLFRPCLRASLCQ
ncbi:hypothetical protein FRC12_000519 [Ceratobasidium sp. 428]|nr:hypothetical protein FRC12_000519 [Ceratobasidium sp. 428]